MTEISLDSEITNIPRVRLAEIITEKLAEALLGGKILPGEKLPSEASISESFKVSKPIAREALRMLDAAGLVTSSHGKHTRAKELNGESLNRIFGWIIRSKPKSLMEANELRLAVETGISRIAAEIRNPQGIDELGVSLDGMKDSLNNDLRGFVNYDVSFHKAIALCTGNKLIRFQIEGMEAILRGVSEVFSFRGVRKYDDWIKTVNRHECIASAINKGNAIEAEEAMRKHFLAADLATIDLN